MGALGLSLMLACLSLVVARTLTRRRQPTEPQQRRQVMELGPTTQRLGIFGFAQSNVIYDFYQKEPIVFAPRRPIHRRSVAGRGRPTRRSLRQVPWREMFKCEGLQPILGKTLPDFGLAAYLDHHSWNPTWTSALGWSKLEITSSDPTRPSAFHVGQYGSVIALNAPAPQAIMGTGLQWTYESSVSCGLRTNGECIQMTFEYDFSKQ